MYRAINQVNEMFISLIKKKKEMFISNLSKKKRDVYLKKQKQNSE
jgi:hypothetical protein